MLNSLLIFIAILAPLSISYAQESPNAIAGEGDDRTLSPYFAVKGDPSVEGLPLYSTSADVRIMGVIADVTVHQVYRNTGKKPIEALYVFPASTRAAVYGMTMHIGSRVLKAEIQKREQARETYEKAKKEGKSASLLEQERPNVFQMNVANIMPGDTIDVELKYTELLTPENGNYEFVYPTVVGPRYSNKTDSEAGQRDRFVESPYKHEGQKPDYKFDIHVSLAAGMSIDEIKSSSHKVNIKYGDDQASADIALDKSEEYAGNKDFILNYRLSGGKIKTGLLLSKAGGENFFLLMLQPPKRVDPDNMPSREYIFIVDVSGSMYGYPLDISKVMMSKLLNGLKPTDKFNILLFAGSSSFMSCESMAATQDNIKAAIDFVGEQRGGGGTELLPALKKALAVPKDEGFSRSIVILTDGYVAVEEEAFDLIRNSLNKSNFFAFGIGTSVNRFLMEGMARAGQGESFVVTSQDKAEAQAEKFRKYIDSPVMTDIKVDYQGFTTYDVEPKTIPDVMAERPIIIYGKYTGDLNGRINVSGLNGKERLQVDIPVHEFAEEDNSSALRYLWARNRIAELGDYNNIRNDKAKEDQIAELGIKYNLLTNYTSFVAVDYLVRSDGKMETVKQPLPMPEGVSDKAVGGGNIASQASPLMMGYSSSSALKAGGVSGTSPRGRSVEMMDKSLSTPDTSPDIAEPDENQKIDKKATYDADDLKSKVIYPEEARKKNIEGKVILKVLVDKEGYPLKYKVDYTDSKLLNLSAARAAMGIKYNPAMNKNKAVASWLTVPVEFKLADYNIGYERTGWGTYVTTTGVEFREFKAGRGESVKKGSTVTIHYKMFNNDCGKLKDTYKDGKPVTFKYMSDANLPDGLMDGLAGVRAGAKRTIYVSEDFGNSDREPHRYYGESKNGRIIEVEIMNIE